MTTEQKQPQVPQPEGTGGIWLWAGIALFAFAGAGARILSAEPPAKQNKKAETECAEITAGKRQADTLEHLACTTVHGFNLYMR